MCCRKGKCKLKDHAVEYQQDDGSSVPATVVKCLHSGKLLINVNGVQHQVWRQRLRNLPANP